jgi:FkbM family methyltransferase
MTESGIGRSPPAPLDRRKVERAWAWHSWTPRWLPTRAAGLLRRAALSTYSAPGVCTLDTGRKMIVTLKDFIQCTIAQVGEWEGPIHQAVRRYVDEGDVVLDVGGHVGYSTLHFAEWVGPGGRVFAFEPLLEHAACIEANVALNGFDERVEVVRAAVSDRRGEIEFAASPPLNSGMGAISPGRGGRRVPTIALDDWLQERGLEEIALLKLDIEGAEALAIRGLERTFAAKRIRSVFLEVHPDALPKFGSSTQAVLERLGAAGFSLSYWDNVGSFVGGPRPDDSLYVLALA